MKFSQLVRWVLGINGLSSGFSLRVPDFVPMTAETFSYMPKKSNAAANDHKHKPTQESAECVASEIGITSHIQSGLPVLTKLPALTGTENSASI